MESEVSEAVGWYGRGIGTDVADAASDGIGNVYADDEAEPPSYATLPAFWRAELADVTRATGPPPG